MAVCHESGVCVSDVFSLKEIVNRKSSIVNRQAFLAQK